MAKKKKASESTSSSSSSGSSSDASNNDVTNIAAAQLAATLANNAAQQEYLRMRLYLMEIPEMQQRSLQEQDQIAFNWGQLAWQQAFQTASLTGKIPAGGLHLQMPNVQTIRQMTGVQQPGIGTMPGGVTPNFGSGFTPPGGGTAPGQPGGGGSMPTSGGGAAQLGAAIRSAGLSGLGSGWNSDNPTQQDFDTFIGHMKASGSGPNDPRLQAIINTARSIGYNTQAYDAWNGSAPPGQQQLPPPVFTPVPSTPTAPLTPVAPVPAPQPAPVPGGESGVPPLVPGLAPGETPTLEYINTLANLTGQIGGNPTLQAGIATGNVNGTPTLEAQIAQGLMANGMPTLQAQQLAGQMANGQRTLEAQQLSGYMANGDPTLGMQSEQNQRAVQLMQLAASLRQDPFRMMRVIGNTPGGLQDVFNAAAGRLQIPGFSGGQPGTAPTLGQFTGDMQAMLPAGGARPQGPGPVGNPWGNPGGGQPPGTGGFPDAINADYRVTASSQQPQVDWARMPASHLEQMRQQEVAQPGSTLLARAAPGTDWARMPVGHLTQMQQREMQYPGSTLLSSAGRTPPPAPVGASFNMGAMQQQPGEVSPPGTQAPPQAYNYQPNSNGTYDAYPPGTSAPQQNAQASFNAPSSIENVRNVLASTPYLPPSQIAPQAYNRMGTAQRKLLFQSYDSTGLDPDVAEETYQSSLPKYATSRPRGRVAVENR